MRVLMPLLLVLCLGFTSVAAHAEGMMDIEVDDAAMRAELIHLLEQNAIWHQNGDDGLLQVKAEDSHKIPDLFQQAYENVLPVGRSAQFAQGYKAEVEARLRAQRIPFENKCVGGVSWTLWQEEHARQVRRAMSEAKEEGVSVVGKPELCSPASQPGSVGKQ